MSGQQKKILIAEDNSALRGVVRFNLERAGYCVTAARNGEEAWREFEQQAFDCVVTDHQMPELSGCELSRRIRTHHDRANTPVVLLSAKGLELDANYLRNDLRISLVFAKPFSPIELVGAIEFLLAAETAETH